MNRSSHLLPLLAALALFGCEEKDKTPPPPPAIDPIVSPTLLKTVLVTGSAEFNAKIHLTGASADVDTVADQFTARWHAEVTLTPDAANALSVTATDAAGNVSEPTVVTVVQEHDSIPPPLPVVDPVPSPTPLSSLSMTGSAEFGAKIRIAGGASDVDTVADQFTARWRVTVPLKPDVENVLTVTATDAAGNVSGAVVVKVVQASSKPASIKLSFSAPSARAGELVGLLTRVLDQYGNEMPDAVVTFGSTPALAATFTIPGVTPAVTKDQGVLAASKQFVAYDLSAVSAGGYQFQVKATAGTVSDTQVLVVRPAPALTFSKLAFVPSGTTATVKAGVDVDYAYEVIDLYGNVTTGPVQAFTNAPGAVVVDDGVSGKGKLTRLTAAGTWDTSFYIAGAGQKGSLTVNVGVAAGAVVELGASTSLTSPQSKVQVFAKVRDAFGNLIGCNAGTGGNLGSMTFAATGALPTSVAPTATALGCFNGAFTATFAFPSEDTWAISATWAPTGATAVSSSVFVTVLAFDNTPPTVSITNVVVISNANGTSTPCPVSAAGCDLAFGDTLTFDVVATDNYALAQVGYGIFFENRGQGSTRTVYVPANQATWTSSFRFNVPNTVEISPLVATAMDRAGNFQNSAALTLRVNSGVPLGGRVLTAVASGNLIDAPVDVAGAANGDIYLVNSGNNNGNREVLRIAAGSNVPVAVPGTNNVGARGSSLMVARPTGTERLYVTDVAAAGDLLQFDLTGANKQVIASSGAVGGLGINAFTGFGLMPALPARGWLDFVASVDGAQFQLSLAANPTELYEIDTNGACATAAGKTCVTASPGGANIASAVAAALGTNSALVTGSSAGTQVILASRQTGETAGVAIAVPQGTIARSLPTLQDGHDQDFYVGNDSDATLRRYLAAGGAHGTFGAQAAQLGLVVADVWGQTANNLNFLDMMAYVVQRATSNLVAFHYTSLATAPGVPQQNNTPAPTFTVNSTTVGAPTLAFTNLADVVMLPSGCLAVSDTANIFTVDVRNAKSANPAVERIARNLATPAGLGVIANGGTGGNASDLLIAVTGANAVIRLSPTADPTDCF